MTRKQVNRKLRLVYVSIAMVLAVSAIAALAKQIPGLPTFIVSAAQPLYELLRDMSLLIATLAAAYLANVFQKRSTFVASLEREWRNIVCTKSTLFKFCETRDPTREEYLDAFCMLSDTIDTMRVVYRNAGETDKLVGLYPYAPLHDMRRVLQSVEPSDTQPVTPDRMVIARDAILQSFYALRENFLEELDLEEPSHPLLMSGGRRLKSSGATQGARRRQQRQVKRQERSTSKRPDLDAYLHALYEAEEGSSTRGLSGDQSNGQRKR